MHDGTNPDWNDAVTRARAHAPFLARALDRQPELAELLSAGDGAAAMEWTRQQGAHEDTAVALRRERLALATTLAIGDLARAFPLAQIVGELSAFADRALDRAIRTAIRERTDEDGARGMIALALGKQGAGELNYSSDIDPILLYDPATLPRRAQDDPGDAANRYARRVIGLLSENTSEGYVLRVDLRLRPASEISPLAVAKGAALAHYQGAALAWERAAFIRARAAAGDIAAGEAFLQEIGPFIWRSHLDFGAIEEIRQLTLRIRESHDGPREVGPGFDVKRGRGGIREIEFFAQTHQLIHGGRDPSLRVRGTRAALNALSLAGRISPEDAAILGAGYDRLREIEHRLQMVNDRQTHSLPDAAALDGVARLDGHSDGAALVAELTELTGRTGSIYEQLIGTPSQPAPRANPASDLAAQLGELGFDDSATLAQRIAGWSEGRFVCLRTPQALRAFHRVRGDLLAAIAASDDPMRAITRWETILERVPSAITLFQLLSAQPHLLDRLVATLTLAPVLSDELARRPELLDTLLDRDALDLPGDIPSIMARMEAKAARRDYEALLDAIRVVTGEIRFALGVQLIEGLADPLDIASALSRLAEAALALAMRETVREFAAKHGRIAGGELLVLGLGRLGGGALTHASDLDIVYLFTGDFAARSDGPRPLGATQYFNRLASRVSAALSVPTAQGALYEVDTRLRPQGAQGPLAVSCDAFAKYQRDAAWTWEHMALARARVLEGSDTARRDLDALLRDVVRTPRNVEALRDAVVTMRGQMALHKRPGGTIDAKLLRGGLVDLEFVVQFLQLRGVTATGAKLAESHPRALDPDLTQAIAGLVEADLLPPEIIAAHELMTRMLVAGRLLAPGGQEPPPSGARAMAQACGAETYDALLQAFGDARQSVARVWQAILGTTIRDNQEEMTR